MNARTLGTRLPILAALLLFPVLAASPSASAGFGVPDPPAIAFAEAIIDTGRNYSVLAGGGMDGLAPDEKIVDISLTAWIGEQDCGDRDDPSWPNGPIVLNAVAPWTLPDDPFMSRSVFVSDDFAGQLLCIDHGLGITTQNDYFRVWSAPAFYLLRLPPQPAPEPEPEQAAPAEPSAEPTPAPTPEPEPGSTPALEDDRGSEEDAEPDDTPDTGPEAVSEPEEFSEGGPGAEAREGAPIGAEGVVLDEVNQAGGQIVVDGVPYPARSLSGMIPSGSLVVVVGVVEGVAVVEGVSSQAGPRPSLLTAALIGLVAVLAGGVWWLMRASRKRRPVGMEGDRAGDAGGPPQAILASTDPESSTVPSAESTKQTNL